MTGSGILTLRGPKIRQEAWVTVWVSRIGQDTSLTSNDHRVTGHTPGATSALKLNTDLWLGGVNSSVGLPDVLPSREGFIGCVQHVKVCLDGCLWQRIGKCRLYYTLYCSNVTTTMTTAKRRSNKICLQAISTSDCMAT